MQVDKHLVQNNFEEKRKEETEEKKVFG